MKIALIDVVAFIIALTLIIFAFPINGFAETHERDSWYIGFGIGGGIDARFKLNGKDLTFDDWLSGAGTKNPLISLNFKTGKTLSPKTLLGFDGTLISQTGKFGGSDARIQINNYFLMLTHFPWAEGFFVRGGGGLSNIQQEIKGTNSTSAQANGYGVLGGIGYAFWLGKTFNLTLNMDHSRQYYAGGSNKPDNSQFTSAYVGFDWY